MTDTLSDAARARLTTLLAAVGPSGYEAPAARLWRGMAAEFCTDVTADSTGNSLATVQGTVPRSAGGPVVMLMAHIDEIGLVVRHIDEHGYLWVASIGGWDPTVLVGQRMRFLSRGGETVMGVIGRPAAHLLKDEDEEKGIKIKSLWVDIGAASRADAETVIRVGDAGVIDTLPLVLRNGLLTSRALDNRLSTFIALEALREYAATPGVATVVAVANTQEEFSRLGGGAITSANRVRPDMAIVLDLTHASDHPALEEAEVGYRKLGDGVVIVRGGATSPVVVDRLEAAAATTNTPYSLEAVGGMSGTDMDAVAIAAHGTPVAVLSVPCRYMHSPNETVSLVDVAHAIRLVAEACRAVESGADFTIR